jgi:hypothetical protein
MIELLALKVNEYFYLSIPRPTSMNGETTRLYSIIADFIVFIFLFIQTDRLIAQTGNAPRPVHRLTMNRHHLYFSQKNTDTIIIVSPRNIAIPIWPLAIMLSPFKMLLIW